MIWRQPISTLFPYTTLFRSDVVVIGGAEELLTYEAMNVAFRMLMDGAVLLAMHRNLYWRASDGLMLDSGPYEHRSEEHTSELQSHHDLVCRLLLEKKKQIT